MEDNKLKEIMLGGSDLPNCRYDQYHVVDSFVPMISDEEYFDSLPPGYCFEPTDEELIVDYLSVKIKGMPLPPNRIRDIKVYDFLPCYLFETYKTERESEVYFFTVRERKYNNGQRPTRVAGDGIGYWRASQKEKPIFSRATGRRVGYRRSLAYHEFGESPESSKRGVKTHWLMHEYRISDNLDEWVICKIYKVRNKKVKAPQPIDDVPNEAGTTNGGSMLAPLPTSQGPMLEPLAIDHDWYTAGLDTYDPLLYDVTYFRQLFFSGGCL